MNRVSFPREAMLHRRFPFPHRIRLPLRLSTAIRFDCVDSDRIPHFNEGVGEAAERSLVRS